MARAEKLARQQPFGHVMVDDDEAFGASRREPNPAEKAGWPFRASKRAC